VHSPGRLGQGSTFTVTLPVIPAAPAAVNLSAFFSKPGESVMVLSEKEDGQDRIQQSLRERGFDVQFCRVDEKSEWTAQLTAIQPAALILDEELAVRQGWAIVDILKRNAATEHIPVFACSLHAERDQGEWLELNFLHKPLQASQLQKEMGRLLAKSDRPQTVLIVDDDPNILNMNRRLVEGAGKKVITARNGREAMELLTETRPDLILLDLMMPVMDGFEVLDALRASEYTREIPVIILTARLLSDADLEHCNRGVASILGKGLFSAEETLGHIEAALARQNSLSGATRQLIRKAMACIHAHYAEPITREFIAEQVGISADYLTDCFRQEFGVTPITYIRRYRIHQACELLQTSDQTITQVAMNVGFADGAHFTRTFFREMGLTPKAYRHQTQR